MSNRHGSPLKICTRRGNLVCLTGNGLAADRTSGSTRAGAVLLIHAAGPGRAHPAAHAAGALWPTLLIVGTRRLGAGAGALWPAVRGRGGTAAIGAHGAPGRRVWSTLTRGGHRPRRRLGSRVAWSALRRHRALALGIIGPTATGATLGDDRGAAGAALGGPGLHRASRQAGSRDDTLLRPVKADTKGLL